MSINRSKGKSTSTPSTAADYRGYTASLDKLTGGRLGNWAKTGTEQLTADQLRAYGGAGATRTAEVNRARERALEEIAADPNLDVAQRQRSRQLTDQDTASRLDAINKETEGLIAEIARAKNALTAQDLEALAAIFYGGKGQTTTQKQTGMSGSFWG